MSTVALHRRRILLDDRPHLLLAGEVHYFRLNPGDWADRLRRLRDVGGDTVATYIPWIWHELPDRSVDLDGRTHPQRNLVEFLDLAHRLGLRVIARPGPFVMAELKNEGIPYRVYTEAPHLLPTTWDGRIVPTRTVDYLAPEFLTAAEGWYAEVMPVIAERLAPLDGPVVAVQLDNEIGMLSWVTNSPDLTDTVCADLRRWAVQRYGEAEASARFGMADPESWAAVLRHPPEEVSLAVHDDLGRYMRDRYRRYVLALRRAAERHGIEGVPLIVNVHGTDAGRGRTFPIGISQLYQAYRGQPQLTSGSDLYLGDLTVTNLADLYVANAFMAAVHDRHQPLTSMEFEAGTGDYGEDLSVLNSPEAVELKTRLCVAQGNRLLNLYLFAGGHNPPLAEPVGDGNDRIASTGQRHGFAAPVGPEGRLNPTYPGVRRALHAVRAVADLLADSDEEYDDVALGFVPDHYLTEYHHPDSAVRAAQVADLERFRGTGPRDVLARALLFTGLSFPALDLQSDALDTAPPPVLALASAATLRRNVQERLARYVHDGGRLLVQGVLPDRDHDGRRCRVLADALGLRPVGRVDTDPAHYFPSVVGHGFAVDRPEVRTGYAQLLDPGSGTPVLTEIGSGGVCGVEVRAGRGRALVIGCDYPCHVDFWRTALARLDVRPRLSHDAESPGLVMTSTVDRTGQRLLHLVNVTPYDVTCTLTHRGEHLLGGRRIRIGARTGLILPAGVRIDAGTLVASTAELAGFDGTDVLLRPTQDEDVVVLETNRTVTSDRGDVRVDGTRVSVTVPRRTCEDPPIRLTLT